jgi:Glycosyltransferase family 87
MRRAIASHGPSALMAAAGCLVLAWLGLYGFAWNDYDNEARPAVEALLAGHLSAFLSLAPAYGGSLIERAPFAFIPGLWGGGSLAVYRLLALPCLLASAVLGVWLLAGMRAEGRPPLSRGVALAVCVANPLTLRALEIGHPEELLGGVLCVFAVVLAARGQVLWAAVLLGLAIANKEWALLATGPVLLALPRGRRIVPMVLAGTVGAVLIAPFLLAGSGSFAATTRAVASSTSPIFQPWQVWWFLGHHGPLVHGLLGEAKPGYRTPPAWVSRVSHPLIILTGALVTAGVALSRRGARLDEGDALLALAVLLLLRCVLDSWDAAYYPLPFVLALLTWEARRPGRQPPVLALAVTALSWLSFQWLPGHVSPDLQSAVFMAWSLPLVGALGLRLFARPVAREDSEDAPRARPPQETTVSSLGSLVRTS